MTPARNAVDTDTGAKPLSILRTWTKRGAQWTTTRGFRVVVLIAVLAFLEVLVFRGYLRGQFIPPWDFLGGYNSDAFLWWTEGSFFDPISWVTNTWAGFPAALTLQNSAWYLPVGIAAAFGPYTLHSAAILSALHVALGATGTYLLARSLKQSFIVALLAAVAAFFAVGYYSNAEHVDISRGYALLPWLLLVLSPHWPWSRSWSVPVASLVLWQTLTGAYPGMLVAMAYVGAVWVIVNQLISRPTLRAFLIPAAASFVVALLLSAPRLLPYIMLSGDGAGTLEEGSQFSPTMIGTLLFGYGSSELPNDISMRSFFIPATVIVLAFFARWRDPITRLAASLGVTALLLGMPFWPWFRLVQDLPGIGLSRFTMSDFKPFIVLGAALLACSGMSALLSIAREPRIPRRFWWSLGAIAIFAVVMTATGILGPYTRQDWLPALFILAIVVVVAGGIVVLRARKGAATVLALALIALTALSGFVWADTTRAPWASNRVDTEIVTYGAPVSELLAQRKDRTDLEQRLARLPLGKAESLADMYSYDWNRVYYMGIDSVGGYVNFKGSTTHQRMQTALTDPELGPAFADFLAAPGTILTTPDSKTPTADALDDCANLDSCGIAEIIAAGYEPGNFTYHVKTSTEVTGTFNESYFTGWQVRACQEPGKCQSLEPGRSALGVIQIALPPGDYTLNLVYEAPGRDTGWILFTIGAAGGVAYALVFAALLRTKKKKVEATE